MQNITRRDSLRLFSLVGASAVTVAAATACSNGSTDASSATSSNGSEASSQGQATGDTTKGTVTTAVDLTAEPAGKTVRLWLPVAQDAEYQKVTDVGYDAPSATTAQINTDATGNQMLFVEWDAEADPSTRTVTLSWHASRDEAVCPTLHEEGGVPEDVKPYLEGSAMVPVNQQVIDAANEIVGDEGTYLGKAKAIYEWVIANMVRDEGVEGCGQGDVCALLSTRSGKCTDINSVFTGLCRAVGVPAREFFGIRMNADDITKNQHCWAEFYLPGTGWVSADPADVLKAVLKGGWTKDQEETRQKAEYYWGNLDSERVQLTAGRDLILEPAQSGAALNDFGYPYAEVDGDALNYYDPENFVYAYSFKKDE